MCGIAGILQKDGRKPARKTLDAMRRALGHRGPDGGGVHVSGNIGLVHTRLSIIDVEGGDQPLFSPAGGALVGNGEIYNYVELFAAQDGKVAHRTRSDFEPALSMLDATGPEAAADLRGMYAFAMQTASGGLIAARDPFGIKPLYVYEDDTTLAFASEPKALFAAGLNAPELDPVRRTELLNLNYVAGAATPFRGIRRFAPGEAVAFDVAGAESGRGHVPSVPPADGPPPRDEEEALARFDAAFEDSVRVHQRSDVPYGMFLSGGIDSAALLTMMARLNETPVATFTCGFSGTGVHDEREAARAVARSLGAEHTEVEFSEDDFWTLLPAIADALDDPTVDYATLPTFKLGAEARKSVKVVLSGEGGDEIFAGYGRYRYLMKPWWRGGKRPRTKGLFEGLGVLLDEDRAWAAPLDAIRREAQGDTPDKLQAAQLTDIRGWLPADLLLKLDRCLMAHGVEGRTPFLDPVVAAFGFHLPPEFKVRDNRGKWLVRQWLAKHCPAADAFGRKKGFTVPVGEWIARRGAAIGDLVARQAAVAEIAAPDAVRALFRDAGGKRGRAAWALLFYAVWHKRHIEGAALSGDASEFLSA